MKKEYLLLAIGQLALVFAIVGFVLNSYYLNNNFILAFSTGLLLGLSLVLNLTFLIKHVRHS